MRFDAELTNDEYMCAVDYWSRNHKERAPQAFYEGIWYQKRIGSEIEKTLAYQFAMLRRAGKEFIRELLKPFRRWKKRIFTRKEGKA